MTNELPPIESCGFMRVPTEGDEALWMTCDQCHKSDHFWVADGSIHCRCGARYTHAVRPDGTKFELDALTFVPFGEGPMALADLEWDPARLAMLFVFAIALVGIIATGVWWFVIN